MAEEKPLSEEVGAADRSQSMAVAVRAAANLPPDIWNNERIDTIMRTCTPKGTTRSQFAIFLETCNRYDLNPMIREIWLAEMDGRMMVVTGRDAFVKVMNRETDFRGLISGTVYSKDTFSAKRVGNAVEILHEINGFDRGTRIGGYALIRRQDKPDIFVMRRWDQFQHLHNKSSWKNYGDDMLETRCIVSCARKAYNLAGLEEETAAEDVLNEEKRAVGTADPTAAVAGTADTAQAVRDRLTELRRSRETAGAADPAPVVTATVDAPAGQPEAEGADFEVVDEGKPGQVTAEDEAEMEERLRFGDLDMLRGDDEVAWKAAVEALKANDPLSYERYMDHAFKASS